MNIRIKLAGSLFIVLGFIGISVLLYFVMSSPIKGMENEERILNELRTALTEEQQILGKVIPGTFNYLYPDYLKAAEVTVLKFEMIEELTILPEVNERIAEALDIITSMENLTKKNRRAFQNRYELVMKDLREIYNFSGDITFDIRLYEHATSDKVIDHEKFYLYRQNIEKFIGSSFSLYDNLGVDIELINKQFIVIDEEIQSIFENSRRISLLIGLLTTLTGIALSLLINGKVSKGIRKIDKNTVFLQKKDLTYRFDLTSSDELGRLSNTLNDFLDQLNESMFSIQKTSKNNIQTRDNMISSLNDSFASVKEINAVVSDIDKQSGNLSLSVADSEKAAENIKTVIDNLKSMIDDEVAMVEESSAAVHQIIASVGSISQIIQKSRGAADQLVQLSSQGGEKLGSTAQIIQAISESIGEIQKMSDMINGISAQTNLLAMNAAIEAAHAGESGKGFSVVADEIRKLAEASSRNSKEINQNLKRIISNIEDADHSSRETGTKFNEIDKEISEISNRISEIDLSVKELESGGNQIQEAMVQLQNLSHQVKLNANEMGGSTQTVEKTISTVRDVTDAIGKGNSDITSRMVIIEDSLGKVTQLGDQMLEESEKLNSEVQKFKTD